MVRLQSDDFSLLLSHEDAKVDFLFVALGIIGFYSPTDCLDSHQAKEQFYSKLADLFEELKSITPETFIMMDFHCRFDLELREDFPPLDNKITESGVSPEDEMRILRFWHQNSLKDTNSFFSKNGSKVQRSSICLISNNNLLGYIHLYSGLSQL